jgi:hypothetical protein
MSETYCSTLSTAQVCNVLETEQDRMKRYKGNEEMDAYKQAQELAHEAEVELASRGELSCY